MDPSDIRAKHLKRFSLPAGDAAVGDEAQQHLQEQQQVSAQTDDVLKVEDTLEPTEVIEAVQPVQQQGIELPDAIPPEASAAISAIASLMNQPGRKQQAFMPVFIFTAAAPTPLGPPAAVVSTAPPTPPPEPVAATASTAEQQAPPPQPAGLDVIDHPAPEAPSEQTDAPSTEDQGKVINLIDYDESNAPN
ncbi:uncharacterized protein LOC113211996 [Frankliniella occidentalis]|uniref:Uncharacterized protein LOC113211996 n=1 Tax=Frankliniella occidentalis TaxID=133901 RepID=A0A9C6X3Q1_FRAOC|nr:uncharacterized protein LOC113211996 [Frankliniella occidentalis]